jgi:hypothetical protein
MGSSVFVSEAKPTLSVPPRMGVSACAAALQQRTPINPSFNARLIPSSMVLALPAALAF